MAGTTITTTMMVENAATYASIDVTRTDFRLVIVAIDETDSNAVNNLYFFNGGTKVGQILLY